jgi:hypothetical protein
MGPGRQRYIIQKTNLFPSKIPNNFQKCVIKAATIGFHPFVSLIGKETEENGETMYDIRGYLIQYFLLSIKKMNTTVEFLQPSLDVSFESVMREASKLTSGISDVLVGIIPLVSVIITGITQPSIPYDTVALKWFVPCPKPISRVDRFLTVFDTSVWLTMIIVFVLTSALFWFSANYPDRMVETESKNLRTIPKCMYNAWSIFIGVSVHEMPRSWKMRIFFLIYVCYCFAISTLFQAFFVSYLVEPGYGEKIATLQEILDSSINYGFNAALEFGMRTMEFSDHFQFPLARRLDCTNLKTCLMRMITDGDVATITTAQYANYIFNEFGYQGEMNSPCSLDEKFIYVNLGSVFTKGNPLVNQFNTILRRVLEAGITYRYWEQLKREVILRGRTKYDEDGSSMYFVFKLSHMGPAFGVLGFRYVYSTTVCIAEWLHKRSVKDDRLRAEHICPETPQLLHSHLLFTTILQMLTAIRNINNLKGFIPHGYSRTAF